MIPKAARLILPLSLVAAPLLAQLPGQSFEVRADSVRPTVGDTVKLHLRLRLDDRDLLLDTVPVPALADLDGVRLLSVGRLVRDERRVFHGDAAVAFYRPGRQPAPVFTVTFMRVVQGIQRAPVPSDTAWVEVTPVLPAGEQPLKDLRPLFALPTPWWPWLLLAPAALAAWGVRRQRRRVVGAPADSASSAPDIEASRREALERLRVIDLAGWPSAGQTGRHYEETANVLRDFLASAEQVRARELTTSELVRALAPRRPLEGRLQRGGSLLAQADLVKFAALEPGAETATRFLSEAHDLVEQWPSGTTGAGDAAR